jgi:hypothetical protein
MLPQFVNHSPLSTPSLKGTESRHKTRGLPRELGSYIRRKGCWGCVSRETRYRSEVLIAIETGRIPIKNAMCDHKRAPAKQRRGPIDIDHPGANQISLT